MFDLWVTKNPNLRLLDRLIATEGLKWGTVISAPDHGAILTPCVVENANELNAAYAADGYARVKECPVVGMSDPPCDRVPWLESNLLEYCPSRSRLRSVNRKWMYCWAREQAAAESCGQYLRGTGAVLEVQF